MKKRIFVVLLALTLVLGLMPTYSTEVEAADTEQIGIISAEGLVIASWLNDAQKVTYGIKKIYDGNPKTYFAGENYPTEAGPDGGAYVEFTLAKTGFVSKVDLYTHIESGANNGCPQEFTISAYTGSEWIPITTVSDAVVQSTDDVNVGLIKVDFAPVMCSKMKITITKLGSDGNLKNYFLRLNEIFVYGTSAKLAATPSTNMSVGWANDAGLSIDKLYDGMIAETYFAGDTYPTEAGPDGGAYVELALEEASYVSEVDLYTRIVSGANVGCPKEFTISVYTGREWTPVATGSDADLEPYTSTVGRIKVNFAPVMCDKVKITITKLGTEGESICFRMNEIDVCGTSLTKLSYTPLTNIRDNGWITNNTVSIDKLYDGKINGGSTTSYISQNMDVNDKIYTDQTNNLYLQLDFGDGTYCEVDRLDLYSKMSWNEALKKNVTVGFPAEYTITAHTPKGWVVVAEGDDTGLMPCVTGAEKKTVAFHPIWCDSIKINITKLGTDGITKEGLPAYCVRMSELEVVGRTDSGDLFDAHDLSKEPYELPANVLSVNGTPTEETVLNTAYDYFIHTKDGNYRSVVLYTPMDAHPDSDINVCDLVATIKAEKGIALTSQAALYGADANVDGGIDADDVDSIRSALLGQ